MAVVGLIPFVYAAIRKKKKKRGADRYEGGLATAGAAAAARVRERERESAKFTSRGGAYQAQSCRFAVRSSPADELGVDGPAGRPAPEDLSGQLFSADRCTRVVGTGDYQPQSCRFALPRPSQRGELGTVSCDNGVARRRLSPADPPGQRLLPASHQNDRRVTNTVRRRGHAPFNGGAYQSQSCRFAVRPLPLGDDFDFSHEDDGALPEDHPQRLLLPDSRHERGLSRSLRFSSMRVFAWVSGA